MEIYIDSPHNRIMMNKSIILMGIPSSGNTLVYNIYNHIFDKVISVKKIDKKYLTKNNYNVITYRDPRSVLYSLCYYSCGDSIDFYNNNKFKITEEMIKENIGDVVNYFNQMNKFINAKFISDTIFLKYESFVNCYDTIFNSLLDINEDINLSYEEKIHITGKFCKNNKNQLDNYLDGKEIVDEWEHKIPRRFHDYINTVLYIPITEWGYNVKGQNITNFY